MAVLTKIVTIPFLPARRKSLMLNSVQGVFVLDFCCCWWWFNFLFLVLETGYHFVDRLVSNSCWDYKCVPPLPFEFNGNVKYGPLGF